MGSFFLTSFSTFIDEEPLLILGAEHLEHRSWEEALKPNKVNVLFYDLKRQYTTKCG
jgi:hypothetical protein